MANQNNNWKQCKTEGFNILSDFDFDVLINDSMADKGIENIRTQQGRCYAPEPDRCGIFKWLPLWRDSRVAWIIWSDC